MEKFILSGTKNIDVVEIVRACVLVFECNPKERKELTVTLIATMVTE